MSKRNGKTKKRLKKVTESVKIKDNISVNNEEQEVQKMDETKVYFKESFINELLKDSYQNYLKKVEEFVVDKKKEIFSENYEGKTFVLGTFKEHAIASDIYGNLKRLHLEHEENGLRCKNIEEVQVKKYSKEDVQKELSLSLAEKLEKSTNCEDEECEKEFQESFKKLMNFSTCDSAEGFINIIE